MAHALARCQQLGLPASVFQAYGRFLDTAHYHLKTLSGVSTEFYQHGQDGFPTHGPGQGSTQGPPLWCVQSSALMQATSDHHKGVDFCNPTMTQFATHVLQGFVNDVSNASNQFRHTLQYFATTPYAEFQSHSFLKELLNEATATAQRWESLLWTVGGKLEFKKCFLYILHWLFDDKGTPYPAELNFFHHDQIEVSLVDSESSVPTVLTLLPCSQATRTLGCMVALDGQMSAELGRLIAKSTKLAITIATQQL